MKKTLSLAFLFLIEISAFAAKKQQIPEWVLNLESVFPAEHFITKEGIGKTQDEARLNALSEISFFFDTRVNSIKEAHYNALETEDANGKSFKTQKELQTSTRLNSNIHLNSVEFEKPWKDKKKKEWHCLCYIKRENLWNQYDTELSLSKDDFLNFLKKAESCEEPFAKITLLETALEKGIIFLDKLSYAEFLSEKLTNEKYNATLQKLSKVPGFIYDVKSQNPVYIEVTEDQGKAVYSAVLKALTDSGFQITSEKKNAGFTAKVNVNLENYLDDEIYVYSPSVQIDFSGKNGSLYVYSKNFDKIKVYTENLGKKKCITAIVNEINTTLKENFTNERKVIIK